MSQLLSEQFQTAIEVHCLDNPNCTCDLLRLSRDILPLLRDAERLKRATVQPTVTLCSPDDQRSHLVGLDGLCWRCGKRFAVIADQQADAP